MKLKKTMKNDGIVKEEKKVLSLHLFELPAHLGVPLVRAPRAMRRSERRGDGRSRLAGG